MIDKLDLRAPASATFRPEVERYVRVVNPEEFSHRVKPNAYYSGKCDLRPLGLDAILFLNCKFQPSHNHKLEILDAGKKSYSEWAQIAESVFDCDSRSLDIVRIDLAADVRNIPVSWLKPRVRIKFKRTNDEHGKLEYGQFGKTQVETLRAGKGENLFRIYNKTEESKMQYRRLCRKASRDAEPPDFEREFGYPANAVVTRFERQCRGRSVPETLGSFGKLPNAPEHDPFDVVEIVSSGEPTLPGIEECESPTEYFVGIGLHTKSNEMGMQQFRPWLNRVTTGNGARTMRRYERFFPSGEGSLLTREQLYKTYRESVTRQLSA
jgi:hypothetical protein